MSCLTSTTSLYAKSFTCKRMHGEEQVAERFEIYYQGVELANGFHELTDAREQKLRFKEANQSRLALGKETLPPDENFLSKHWKKDCPIAAASPWVSTVWSCCARGEVKFPTSYPGVGKRLKRLSS